MNTVKTCCIPVSVAALLTAAITAWATDNPKLAAPLYQGAVPAISADGIQVNPAFVGTFGGMKALDCRATTEARDFGGQVITPKAGETYTGPWCFLSKDPIDKVKAYYDKTIAPMHAVAGNYGRPPEPVKGYVVFTERAWFPGGGEAAAPGYGYTGVSLHALPSPPNLPANKAKNSDDSWEGQETYQFYAGSRHFNGFIDAVDWFGDPSKRKPAELNAYYEKHKRIESALYQRKGPKQEAVDESLRAKYGEKSKQTAQNAIGMMPGQGQMDQMEQMMKMMQAGQMPAGMPMDPQAERDDAAFEAYMQKHPKVAARYAELSSEMNTLVQQGKFDEADAVDEELQKLIDDNPELAAIERGADERSAAASAAAQARENQAVANYQGGMDQASWATWQEYITAAEKEAYYTLIVIDRAFTGKEEQYSRDRKQIESESAGEPPHSELGFHYDYQQSGTAAAPTAPAATQSAKDTKPDVKDTFKKGLKSLKSLF